MKGKAGKEKSRIFGSEVKSGSRREPSRDLARSRAIKEVHAGTAQISKYSSPNRAMLILR